MIQRDSMRAKVDQSMPVRCYDCGILFCHVLSSALFLPATEGSGALHDVGLLDGWVLSSRGNVERNSMSERMPEDMPEKMLEDMPDRMRDRMPEDLPEQMPADMPGRVAEDMPDRVPDRMPEDVASNKTYKW